MSTSPPVPFVVPICSDNTTVSTQFFLANLNDQICMTGKYKTNFTPHADCGDYVVIINAGKVIMTGKKMTDRRIFSHTGYPGGQKRVSPSDMLAKDETSLVRHAVKGMLPKNKLGAAILRNCYIYPDLEHDKQAQKPKELNLNNLK